MFIDDNSSNCREVEHYNEGITTYTSPTDMVVNWKEYKDDTELARLNQYKILEKKAEFRVSCSDNTDFLRQSNIRLSFIKDYSSHIDRLEDLINRSNQLNFTKFRIGVSDIESLMQNPNIESAAISVVDNFGDYGICGFYALETKSKRYCISCFLAAFLIWVLSVMFTKSSVCQPLA